MLNYIFLITNHHQINKLNRKMSQKVSFKHPNDPIQTFWYKLSTTYMGTSGGHDKVVRFIQYSTRFIIPIIHRYSHLLNPKNPEKFAKNYEKILKKTRRELSTARRTLRLFKQIQVLWTVYKLIRNFPENKKKADAKFSKYANPCYVTLKCANNFFAAIFFSLDHVFWSYLIGLHRNRDLVGRVGDICDYIWITQNCFNIAMKLVEMQLNQSKIKNLEKELLKLSEIRESKWTSKNESRRKKLLRQVAKLEDTNNELPLEIIKSFCDSIVSTPFLPLFNFFRPPSSS